MQRLARYAIDKERDVLFLHEARGEEAGFAGKVEGTEGGQRVGRSVPPAMEASALDSSRCSGRGAMAEARPPGKASVSRA